VNGLTESIECIEVRPSLIPISLNIASWFLLTDGHLGNYLVNDL